MTAFYPMVICTPGRVCRANPVEKPLDFVVAL